LPYPKNMKNIKTNPSTLLFLVLHKASAHHTTFDLFNLQQTRQKRLPLQTTRNNIINQHIFNHFLHSASWSTSSLGFHPNGF
jgi:hypothetical protein